MSRARNNAISVIEAAIEHFEQHVGEPHASVGATAAIELAFVLEHISESEQASFKNQVLRLYKRHWETTA